MYLLRQNLGDIAITDFSVSDDGKEFQDAGNWDSRLSKEEKAGKYGIIRKEDGLELCWGVGSYGHHRYEAKYLMSNVVKSLNDFDMLHLQLVSPGVEPSPDKVEVRISAPYGMTEKDTGIWGFGYSGEINFTDNGEIHMASYPDFGKKSSVIALVRFPKGIFFPTSVQDRNFEEVLEEAQEGADYFDESKEDGIIETILAFMPFLLSFLAVLAVASHNRESRKKVLGCKMKDVGYCRDIPFEGDILQSNLVLEKLGKNRRCNVAGAIILRMIYNGLITVSKDSGDHIELAFSPNPDLSGLSASERELFDMMKEASGADTILQHNEFRRWSAFRAKRVSRWAEKLIGDGRSAAVQAGNCSGSAFTEKEKENARNLVGLRNYLNDFTLLRERGSQEVILWKEYLVFASLFGIADKVGKELQEINPEAFEQQFSFDIITMNQTIRLTQNMAAAITNARVSTQAAAAARSGHGGMASFGGGGGFSGGGFGGGVR